MPGWDNGKLTVNEIQNDGIDVASQVTKAAIAAGVAADITVVTNLLTSDGDGADNVTLADGVTGQKIEFLFITEGAGGDTIVITPATQTYFNTITLSAKGNGCIMRHDGTAWGVIGNNGGTIA